jgi:hypothetical protein
MKDRSLWGTYLAIILLAPGAWAQQSGAPPKPAEGGASPPTSTGTTAIPHGAESSQKVVLKVGATQVSQAEIEALISELARAAAGSLPPEGRQRIAELYVRMILLSRQALNDHLDSSPALRSRLELQRTRMLAQAEYDKMRSESKVGPDEVHQYYMAHASEFDTIQVREFLVRKLTGGENAEPGLILEDAKTKAEAIRRALVAGTDPEKVAEDFAGPDVVLVDRTPRTLRRGEQAPALENATWGIKDGEVSEPVDTPQAFLVVLVLKHRHLEQKEVMKEIENKLRRQKLDTEMDRLREKAGVWMDEEYFKGKPVATPGSAAAPPRTP